MQSQPTAPQSLLRGLSEGDTAKLLAAIKQGAAAAQSCALELATHLGFSAEQQDTIVKLAQTLAHGQGALEQAQAAMAQAQRNHDKATRALKAQQRKLGLPQMPVPSPIGENGTAASQPQWAQYPEHTITPVGEGPQGGFGEGFSAPSLQERVANSALAAQQAAQQVAQQVAQQAVQQVVQQPAQPAAQPAAPQASVSSDVATLAGAQPNGAAQPSADGTTSDFLKKVDTESKFDFSQQQKDLEAIRAGAGDFSTKVLDLDQLDESARAQKQADEAVSKVIMDTLPQVRQYLKDLEVAAKGLERQLSGNANNKGANYESAISSVVAGIRKAKGEIDAGVKPSAAPVAADSLSLNQPASASEDNFSLSQQGASGFDVNDPRHLGAQLIGSVSLAAHESAAAPGGSFELPTTSAVTASPDHEVPVPPVPKPTVEPQPIDDILGKAQALAQEETQVAPAPVVAPAAPRALSTEVNRSLQSMVTSLQAAEGHSADSLSIDDIMGSDLGAPSLSALTPVNVASVSADVAPTASPSVAGGESTKPESDLPPWNLQTPAPHSKPEAPSVSTMSLTAQAAPTPLTPEAAPQVAAGVAPQVAAGAAPQVAAGVAPESAPESAPQPGPETQSTASGQVSVQGLAQDQFLLEPTSAKVRVDGSTDLSPEKAALRTAAQNLEALGAPSGHQLTDEERHAQQQKMASAALDVLSSFGQQLEKDLEFTQNLGPSPWDELSSVKVISIDAHDFKVLYPKHEKLARISAHNILAQSGADNHEVNLFDGPLSMYHGDTWPQQGTEAIVERLSDALKQKQEEQAQDAQQCAAFKERLEQLAAQGLAHAGISSDYQAILAERNQSLALTEPPTAQVVPQSAQPEVGAPQAEVKPQPVLPEVGVPPAQVGVPAPIVPGAAPKPQTPTQVAPQPSQPTPQELGGSQVAAQPQLAPMQPAPTELAVSSVMAQPPVMPPPAVGVQPMPQAVVSPQPMPQMDVVPPQMPEPMMPPPMASQGLPQPPMPQSPMPQSPMPQPALGTGPDFGPLPDYIAEADASMADASTVDYVGVDEGSDDDDDGINDVDFGSAASTMEAPEAGVSALDSAALALSEMPEPEAPQEPEPLALVPAGAFLEMPGRKRLTQDDFLELVAQEDPWYQLLLQVFPDKGPVYATLTGVQRLVDPNDPNHWHLIINRNVDLSFIDPDFWNNTQKRFEQFLGTKLTIDKEMLDATPRGAPEQLALIKLHEAVVHAREDVKRVKPLNNLFKLMGENWEQVGIELYHQGGALTTKS